MWSKLKNETKKVFIGYVGYLVLATVVGGTFGKVLAVFGLVIGVFVLWGLISTFEENYPGDDMPPEEFLHFRLAEEKRVKNLSLVACSLVAASCLVLGMSIDTGPKKPWYDQPCVTQDGLFNNKSWCSVD